MHFTKKFVLILGLLLLSGSTTAAPTRAEIRALATQSKVNLLSKLGLFAQTAPLTLAFTTGLVDKYVARTETGPEATKKALKRMLLLALMSVAYNSTRLLIDTTVKGKSQVLAKVLHACKENLKREILPQTLITMAAYFAGRLSYHVGYNAMLPRR